ncbi:hypothetical protein ACQKWADRAFT_302531 [Trichoderma austrokoningii]
MLLEADETGLNAIDVHGQTPLAMAAYAGDKGTVQLLLDHRADKPIDKYGRLPGLAIPNLTMVEEPARQPPTQGSPTNSSSFPSCKIGV